MTIKNQLAPRTDAERQARWTLDHSPPKISFWNSDPHAPDGVKDLVKKDPEAAFEHRCMLLPWEGALAVLHRADMDTYCFDPDDHD